MNLDDCNFEIQVYIIDANNPQDGLQKVHTRVSGVQFFLEHHKGFFYILTNASQKELFDTNYYLARCHVKDIHLANWQVFLSTHIPFSSFFVVVIKWELFVFLENNYTK